jgi:hypothetical protein
MTVFDFVFLLVCSGICYAVGYLLVTYSKNKLTAFCCAVVFSTMFGVVAGEIVYKPIKQKVEMNEEGVRNE